VEIFGVASCGKTAFALQVIAHVQQGGARAAWIDAEHVFDAGFAAQLGVDLERLPVAQPSTGEEALEIVRRFAASAAVDLIVLDSAAALVPQLEMEAGLGRAAAGLQTRLLASELRRLSRIAARSGSCVVFLNQTRARIGPAGEGDTSSGGAPIKLHAALRLVLAAAGRRVRFRVLKNRFAAPFRETILEWRPGAGFADAR
jgi:recombination protein RecA